LHAGLASNHLLRRWRSTSATTESTSEGRLVGTWSSTALLVVTLLSSSVATSVSSVLTVSSWTTSASWSVLTTHHAPRWVSGSLLLDVSRRHNLSWEVEPFSEVVETLRSQGVVVVLP